MNPQSDILDCITYRPKGGIATGQRTRYPWRTEREMAIDLEKNDLKLRIEAVETDSKLTGRHQKGRSENVQKVRESLN